MDFAVHSKRKKQIFLIMYVKNITLSKNIVKAHLSTILQKLCLVLSHTTVMSIITVNNFYITALK